MTRALPLALALCALALCAFAPRAQAAAVYDNLTAYSGAENALLPAGHTASGEHGSQVTLEGAERSATQLRLALRIQGAGVATFRLRVRLYRNDGPDGRPGTLLYDEEAPRLIDSGAPLAYWLTLPGVPLPDTFTWTVQVSERQGNMAALGPSLYGPPSTGEAEPGYWRRAAGPEAWEFVAGELPFGARVSADLGATDVAAEGAAPAPLRARPSPAAAAVEFDTPGAGEVRILDARGRLVGVAVSGRGEPARWTPEDSLPSGIYFAAFRARGVLDPALRRVRFVIAR